MEDSHEHALTADELKFVCHLIWGHERDWYLPASEALGINRRTLTRMASGRPENPPGVFLTTRLRELLAAHRERVEAEFARATAIVEPRQ